MSRKSHTVSRLFASVDTSAPRTPRLARVSADAKIATHGTKPTPSKEKKGARNSISEQDRPQSTDATPAKRDDRSELSSLSAKKSRQGDQVKEKKGEEPIVEAGFVKRKASVAAAGKMKSPRTGQAPSLSRKSESTNNKAETSDTKKRKENGEEGSANGEAV